MKTEIGISVAALAVLAAQGKDFDRATLNAMLEKLAASPEPWIRLKFAAYGVEDRGVLVQQEFLTDLSYGDGDFALEERFNKVSWVINGKRTPAQMSDVKLLKTFLSGGLVLTESRDVKVPLKRRMDRLRELLGETKK